MEVLEYPFIPAIVPPFTPSQTIAIPAPHDLTGLGPVEIRIPNSGARSIFWSPSIEPDTQEDQQPFTQDHLLPKSGLWKKFNRMFS